MFSRRSLLAILSAAAVDPERLLWEPGKKLIFIPKPQIFVPTQAIIQYQFVLLTLQSLDGKDIRYVETPLDPKLTSMQNIFIAPEKYRIVDATVSFSHLGAPVKADITRPDGRPLKGTVLNSGDNLVMTPVKLLQN